MLELWDRLPPNLRGTLRTLVTIALNGGCAALASVVIDPDHFNLDHLKHIGIVFGVGALAAVVNWLRQSPWKTADDRMMTTIARSVPFVMIAGLMGLAALTAGCGPKQYHTAVAANTSIAQAIFAVQDAEIAAHKAGLVSDAKHTVYKAQILTLLEAGDELTVAIREWDPSRPAPVNVARALSDVSKLLMDLKIESPQATNLLFAVQAVISVLRGSGVLPAADASGGASLSLRPREKQSADADSTEETKETENHALILLPSEVLQFGDASLDGVFVSPRTIVERNALPAVTGRVSALARADDTSEIAKFGHSDTAACGIRRLEFISRHALILLPEVTRG